jgi:uncharacterized membrane protein
MAIETTYASEIAPLKLRGPVQQALVLFYVFMLGHGLAIVRIFVPNIHEQAFRDVFAIQWAVGGIAVVAFALTPESPNYLINKGRIAQAYKVLGMIYGRNNSIDARLAYLAKNIREEQENKELHSSTYFECFKGVDRRRTLAVMFIYSANNWGDAALLSQSIYFLIIAGLPAIHAFDVSIGGFGLSMVIIIASWFIGDKVRRRDAFAGGCWLNFLFMLIIGALYYAPGTGPLWAIAVLMLVRPSCSNPRRENSYWRRSRHAGMCLFPSRQVYCWEWDTRLQPRFQASSSVQRRCRSESCRRP